MQGDRRQIQTAVLGGPDSEEPLMLPLEAIELDAFRRRHEHDTSWGLLLGADPVALVANVNVVRCHSSWTSPADGQSTAMPGS
ncbi:hypothetical protein [Streptomyces prunicolor]|uniref:Uncharacterized protein n=1 Tax=Streptomyces prunicolor TaxID=67348 RepID=A0ABU4FLM2_9ACTN|nr:hypothetical protein [Streptomyces prunicolor]MDV7220175.1 hypothetical protein [Streptomyces prunicolor]